MNPSHSDGARATPERQTTSHATEKETLVSHHQTKQAFVWPPRPQPAQPHDSAATSPSTRRSRATPHVFDLASLTIRPRSLAEHIEQAFVGCHPESLDRWALEAGWEPEPPEAACPRCGRTVGPGEVTDGRCTTCLETPPKWDATVRLGTYDGVLREAVLAAKYRASRLCALQLGRELAHRLAERGLGGPSAAVVPIPTTLRRRMHRGIDHVRLTALQIARSIGSPLLPVLTRKHRPSQVAVAPSRREANVRRSMSRLRSGCERYRCLIVVDDLRTTGATLREACRALEAAGRSRARVDGESRRIVAAVACVADQHALF